jgi:phage gpG-like protein
MYNSVMYHVDNKEEVSAYPGVDYAEYLDQGTSRMVARPFMYLTDESEAEINEILAQHIFGD